MVYLKTSNCIICGQKAVVWFGHVKQEKQKILAGWCMEHKVEHDAIHKGYCGSYLAEKHGKCLPLKILEERIKVMEEEHLQDRSKNASTCVLYERG